MRRPGLLGHGVRALLSLVLKLRFSSMVSEDYEIEPCTQAPDDQDSPIFLPWEKLEALKSTVIYIFKKN